MIALDLGVCCFGNMVVMLGLVFGNLGISWKRV